VAAMIGLGTIINAAAILLGGLLGLTVGRQLSMRRQMLIKTLLGVFTVYVGLKMFWENIGGTFGLVMKQIGIIMLALVVGNLIGKLLRLQKGLNRLGQLAQEKMANAQSAGPHRFSEGFVTCTLLFCVGPMAVIGALKDGLDGHWKILGVKAVMDGLATMAFVTTFGWGVILSVIPVVAYQGSITLLAQWVAPFLERHNLVTPISATGGLLVACISLVILDVRRVSLADYMPSLVVAPALSWWWA
jgi:uncharacterized membrane protein YqgA involved in biofilm formation